MFINYRCQVFINPVKFLAFCQKNKYLEHFKIETKQHSGFLYSFLMILIILSKMKSFLLSLILSLMYSAVSAQDNKITLISENVSMTIDPQASGRIISFAINGKNILSGEDVHSFNYGSTLWPAPQSEWHWPPYPALDKEPYAVVLHQPDELLLRSKPDSVSGFQFGKHIMAKTDHFQINYTITNASNHPKKVAAWEVTRVDTSGRAFFPLSGEAPLKKSNLENIYIRDKYLWYEPDYHGMEKSQKYYGYGKKGYLGWVNGNILFVKSFPDITPSQPAPGQAEIEIFAHAEYPYIELENHGPFVALKPGETLNYKVKWYLQIIPEDLEEQIIIELAESFINKIN